MEKRNFSTLNVSVLLAAAVTAVSTCVLFLFPLSAPLRFVDSERWLSVFFSEGVLHSVRISLEQSFWSVLGSLGIGVPFGLLLGRVFAQGSAGSLWISWLLSFSFGLPSVVAALVGVLWLGRTGVLGGDWLYSLQAVIGVHIWLNASWVALAVAQTRAQIPVHLIETVKALGASRWDLARWVFFPALSRVILSVSLQVFQLCMGSFAIVLLLGGGPPVETLETEIYSRLRLGGVDLSGALACGTWQLILMLGVWAVSLFFPSSMERLFPAQAPAFSERRSRFRWKDFGWVFLSLIWVMPVSVLVILPSASWAYFFGPEFISAFQTSMLLMGASTGGVLFLVIPQIYLISKLKSHAGWGRALELLFQAPSAISISVLALGMLLWVAPFWDVWAESFWILVLVQIGAFLPWAFRLLLPQVWVDTRPQLEGVRALGASPFRAFWLVEWPRWKRPILQVWAWVSAASLSEVVAVSLFSGETWVSLPLLMSRELSRYRFDEAQALGLFLFGGSWIFMGAFLLWSQKSSGWKISRSVGKASE